MVTLQTVAEEEEGESRGREGGCPGRETGTAKRKESMYISNFIWGLFHGSSSLIRPADSPVARAALSDSPSEGHSTLATPPPSGSPREQGECAHQQLHKQD